MKQMNVYPNSNNKRNKIIASVAGLGISLGGISACGNSEYKTPEVASITSVSPNTVAPSAESLASTNPSAPESNATASSEAENQSLDTNYDETKIIEEINLSRTIDIGRSVAALEIAKNPEYAIQLGASEIWWQAQIDIANAYIQADDSIRALDNQDSLGHDFTAGFFSKAMLPLYASGLQMAKEYNIPVLTENDQMGITINGLDSVGLGNLGLDTWVQSAVESKALGQCVETLWEFDESIYNPNDPRFVGKDERVIEILKQQDKTIHIILENYLTAIDVHC